MPLSSDRRLMSENAGTLRHLVSLHRACCGTIVSPPRPCDHPGRFVVARRLRTGQTRNLWCRASAALAGVPGATASHPLIAPPARPETTHLWAAT